MFHLRQQSVQQSKLVTVFHLSALLYLTDSFTRNHTTQRQMHVISEPAILMYRPPACLPLSELSQKLPQNIWSINLSTLLMRTKGATAWRTSAKCTQMQLDRRLPLQLRRKRGTITEECADTNRILLPPLNTLLLLFSSVTPKPSFLLCPELKTNPQERVWRATGQLIFTEVDPDRSPLVGRQPLIGQWWCHHPEECVKGLSCSRDRGFVSFPCSDPLTSSQFSCYIYVRPQGCLLTPMSLCYKCLFNPIS